MPAMSHRMLLPLLLNRRLKRDIMLHHMQSNCRSSTRQEEKYLQWRNNQYLFCNRPTQKLAGQSRQLEPHCPLEGCQSQTSTSNQASALLSRRLTSPWTILHNTSKGQILRTTSGFASSTIAISASAGKRTSNLTCRLTLTIDNSNAITATNG